MMNIKPITPQKTIIFDMDGVLFDTEQLFVDCWKQLAQKYKIIGIEEVCYACIGTKAERTREIVLEHYGSDFPYDKYRSEISILFQDYIRNNGVPIKPGVNQLLTLLKNTSYSIGLASSTKTSSVRTQLDSAHLLPFFDVIIAGDMVEKSKPEPDIFLRCCNALNGIPKDTYVIEDSFNGIRAASRAGMIPIMVPDLIAPNEEMQQLAAHIFPSLNEVCDFFKNKKETR